MKHALKPRTTAIVQTLAGEKVRILKMDPTSQRVQVKHLSTGLPYFTTADKLRLPE